MVLRGINRKLAVRLALIAIPIEILALYLLSFVPLDIGFPPGTNPLWQITLIGLFVHAPAFFLLNMNSLPHGLIWPTLFIFGYCEIVGLAFVLVWTYRRLSSSSPR
jgi:hypothetical protein